MKEVKGGGGARGEGRGRGGKVVGGFIYER